MSLIARVAGDSWDWREDEDVAPTTSRSPSFVRLVGAEPAPELVDEIVFAESSRHATVRPPEDDDALLRRWSDLDVAARTRALRLEETALRIHDRRMERVAQSVLDGANAVADALGVLHLMWSACSAHAAPAPIARLATTYPVVQHVFEWMSGVLSRTEARLSDALDAREHVAPDLGAVEYSSLFVRSIIDPMLTEALRMHAAARDDAAVVQLRELRERVLWLNWTVRALEAFGG